MGAQTSKVARKLPTRPRPETLQNIPKKSPATLGSTVEIASELKTDLIDQDGRDPHLHENLKTLGPVIINPTITKMRATDTMLGIINKRNEVERKEIQGLTATEDMLSIDSLFTLLEQRKRLQPGEIEKPDVRQALKEKYKVNEATLSTLLKYYNTIAIMPPAIDDKEERRLGIWVNDKMEWEQKVRLVDERNKRIKKQRQEAIKDNNRAKNNNQNEKEDQILKDLFDESY